MFDEQGSPGMYANILLSTDGSDVARKGLEHGIALAKALNAKVTVITVTEPLPIDFGADTPGDGFPHRKKLIALKQPARNGRAKRSMKLKPWQSRSGCLQNSCIFMFRTRIQPRLSKQQSPEAAI
jgi:nucleotide-binding universal stress UspA family protein